LKKKAERFHDVRQNLQEQLTQKDLLRQTNRITNNNYAKMFQDKVQSDYDKEQALQEALKQKSKQIQNY
jgi:hypothetical protein